MRRRSSRPGVWIARTAVALAAVSLWIGFGLHYAVRGEIRHLLDRIGGNVFYVYHEGGTVEGFREEDRVRVASLPEVAEAAGESATTTGYVPGATYALTYFEVSAEYLSVMRLEFTQGRGFSSDDRGVAVLGSEVAHVVFGNEDPVGQYLEGLRIVGVLAALPEDDTVREPLSRRVLVPLGAAPRGALGAARMTSYWALWIRPTGSIDAAIRAIDRLIPDLHVARLSTRYGWAFAAERTANRFLLFSTAGLFVLAGTIVAGTLSLSSLSRRWEIGVRRAVGARGTSIARLVVRDGLALTLGGGLIGVLLAFAAFPLVARFDISLELGVLHLAVLPLLVALGLLSGLVPAVRSARLSPSEALAARTGDGDEGRALGAGFFVIAVSAAIAAYALYAFLVLGGETLCLLDALSGDIDERTLLASPPRQSILYPPELTPEDRVALDTLSDIELVVVTGSRRLRSINGVNRLGLSLTGVGPGYEDLKLFQILAGRDLTAEEIEAGTKSVLLSDLLAHEVFGERDPVEQMILLDGRAFRVVGVYSSPLPILSTAPVIVAPYDALELLSGPPHAAGFWVRAAPDADLKGVSARIVDAFRERYPGNADVAIHVPAAAIAGIRQDLDGIARRLALLIGAALLLGAANVFHLIRFRLALRRRELAIRRAVGATNAAIVRLGAAQGLLVGIIAAAIGLAAGVATVRPLAGSLGMEVAAISPRYLAATFAALLAIGAAAGGSAGWLASRGTPATALRWRRG